MHHNVGTRDLDLQAGTSTAIITGLMYAPSSRTPRRKASSRRSWQKDHLPTMVVWIRRTPSNFACKVLSSPTTPATGVLIDRNYRLLQAVCRVRIFWKRGLPHLPVTRAKPQLDKKNEQRDKLIETHSQRGLLLDPRKGGSTMDVPNADVLIHTEMQTTHTCTTHTYTRTHTPWHVPTSRHWYRQTGGCSP